ncbi:mechanosensitive ion channel family protein [Caloranaerobacter azorensis]|uniref:Mechanosensitive ion channel family protein n=1 Tax=Caloranaerobacter azorensis TaxID=116090 RepID=A0A6P1YEA7_9FIRM|nr:mechanosensitive ion channel family protein [Caloranaerobacter azorensis]QIB27103.1 mechanosensitive ion channel family protein [Caloranaerobacter azorensis]
MNYVEAFKELGMVVLDMSIQKLLLAVFIFLFTIIMRNIFTKYFLKIALKFTSKTKSEVDDDLVKAFSSPLRTFIVILGSYFALKLFPLSLSARQFISRAFRSSIIITIAWGFYNLEGTYSILFELMGDKFNLKTSKVLKPFFSKIMRVITVVIALGIVAEEFDYDISGFIAGLGIGGLAVAMAAKDFLSNIFGGIVIIMDKPFDIGDWITTSDIEGVVEDISFRSTKIRTFNKAVVTVPNSMLVQKPIINNSRRGIRRITFKLGVTYSTPREKLERCINRIEKMLKNHPGVDKDTIFVKFDGFNDSSLDILLYFFANTSDWARYLDIKHDVNFQIMRILEEEGVEVAFPSTSIYFENALKTEQ